MKNTTNINNTKTWLESNRVRPKTVMVTLTRTQNGYIAKKATVISRKNQYTSQNIDVDVDLIVNDISKKGIFIG